MTDTPRHSVSVAAAIFDESGKNVLLIKRRDNGNWEPPGGILELDETIEEASGARSAKRPAPRSKSAPSPASTKTCHAASSRSFSAASQLRSN